MSNAVTRGYLNGFLREHSRPMIGYEEIMSLKKYCFICALFTIVRAVIKGGLPSEYAIQLSDMYCQRMDVMTSAQEIDRLLLSAGIDFCKKVLTPSESIAHTPKLCWSISATISLNLSKQKHYHLWWG